MFVLPNTTNPIVVHMTPTHTGKMLDKGDSEVPQLILVTNSRLHEHLRRVQEVPQLRPLTAHCNALSPGSFWKPPVLISPI